MGSDEEKLKKRTSYFKFTGRDRQYMHRIGFACVRVHLEMGFVWLLNSTPRISDINWSTEEKKGKAMEKLHNLISFTNIASLCYDIVLEISEIALLKAVVARYSIEDDLKETATMEDTDKNGTEEDHNGGENNSIA